jgi:hypothetical protein
MESTINGYDVFELIAFELNVSRNALLTSISENTELTKERISSSPLSQFEMILSEDIQLKGSNVPFLTAGNNMLEYIDPIFNRMISDPHCLTPPMIQPSEDVDRHLRQQIIKHFEKITDRFARSEQFSEVYAAYEQEEDLRKVKQDFLDSIDHCLSSPFLINNLLVNIHHSQKTAIIENNVNSAYIAMAVLNHHKDFEAKDDRRISDLVDMGLSMLFQDIACISSANGLSLEDPSHAKTSRDLVAGIGLSEESLNAIEHHHRVTDHEGNPFYLSKRPDILESVAVVVCHFVACILPDQYNLTTPQAIFVLSNFAKKHYLDADSVTSLGQLCVGGVHIAVITKSFELAAMCPHGRTPIVWDLHSKMPNRLVCENEACEFVSVEYIELYDNISFSTGNHNIEMTAGVYYKCKKLTKLLNKWLLSSGQYKNI